MPDEIANLQQLAWRWRDLDLEDQVLMMYKFRHILAESEGDECLEELTKLKELITNNRRERRELSDKLKRRTNQQETK